MRTLFAAMWHKLGVPYFKGMGQKPTALMAGGATTVLPLSRLRQVRTPASQGPHMTLC